jgi:NIPSNAP
VILVRLVFQAKFGKAGELAASFKSGEQAMKNIMRGHNVKILTDLSGPFDTVVQEMEYESIQAFMVDQERLFADPGFQATMGRGAEFIRSGYKEYYTIE